MHLVPGLQVVERIGSSESGVLASRHSHDAASASDPTFVPDHSAVVVAEDFSRLLEPGYDGNGWLARTGRIPLGYLRDAGKTARTFPVVNGRRLSIPGDRARLLPGGEIQMLGRASLVINTGGEKVFVEEVEDVLKDHPDVTDAVVRQAKREVGIGGRGIGGSSVMHRRASTSRILSLAVGAAQGAEVHSWSGRDSAHCVW
jgi:acyl-coenzyme A synthetase/AMP-(fatty) acid ligase